MKSGAPESERTSITCVRVQQRRAAPTLIHRHGDTSAHVGVEMLTKLVNVVLTAMKQRERSDRLDST